MAKRIYKDSVDYVTQTLMGKGRQFRKQPFSVNIAREQGAGRTNPPLPVEWREIHNFEFAGAKLSDRGSEALDLALEPHAIRERPDTLRAAGDEFLRY